MIRKSVGNLNRKSVRVGTHGRGLHDFPVDHFVPVGKLNEFGGRVVGEQQRPGITSRPVVYPPFAAAINPSTGLLAVAYNFFGIRPARYAFRPATVACRMAWAIRTGSFAPAIAVFKSTPSH